MSSLIHFVGISEIFNDCQVDKRRHPALYKKLFNLYFQVDRKQYTDEFLLCLRVVMAIDKSPPADRALQFASNYCYYHIEKIEDELDPFIISVYSFLFTNHMREKHIIRFRVCEFINRLLSVMGGQAMIDGDIFNNLANAMLDRLQDRLPSIRAQAAMSLFRLQDPYNTNCHIIKALMFHLETDPSHDVRASVVTHIAITNKTLPVILGRLNDKKDTVRKDCFKAISRIKLLRFSLKHRQEILTLGLRDRSPLVRDYVTKHFIKNWIMPPEKTYMNMLEDLDVQTLDDISQDLLFCLFRQEPISNIVELIMCMQLGESRVVPLESLSPESAVFWKSLVFYTNQCAEEGTVEDDFVFKIIPELTPFTKYIREFSSSIASGPQKEKEFILDQLLKISSSYSFSDEMGRECLRQTCLELLTKENISSCGVLSTIANIMELVVPCSKDRLVMMAEVISDIREPLNADEPSLLIDQPGPSGLQNNGDNPSSSQIQLDDVVREMRNDPATLIKCLRIVKYFLTSMDIVKMDSTLYSLNENFVSLCLNPNNNNAKTINLAIEVLSLMAIRCLEVAKKYFLKVLFLIQDDDLCIPSIKTIFDLLCVHGFDNLANELADDQEESEDNFRRDKSLTPKARKLVELLTFLLQSSNDEVVSVTCQGLSKLFLCGEVSSPIVLSQLIILWFSPKSENLTEIRQPLGMFFSQYSAIQPNAPSVICSAVLPTLRAFYEADVEDPLGTIDVSGVVDMLLDVLRHDVLPPASKVSPSGASYHLLLGDKVCSDLLRTGGDMGGTLTRLLTKLQFAQDDGLHAIPFVQKLTKIIRISGNAMDRRSLKQLKLIKEKLVQLISEKQGSSTIMSETANTTAGTSKTSNDTVTAFSDSDDDAKAISTRVTDIDLNGSSNDVESLVINMEESGNIVPGTPSIDTSRAISSRVTDLDGTMSDDVEMEVIKLEKSEIVVPGTPPSDSSSTVMSPPPIPSEEPSKKVVYATSSSESSEQYPVKKACRRTLRVRKVKKKY